MYVSNEENPGITAVAGSNIVFLCTFRNIVNSQSVGGAISVDIECQLTLIECLFESCESKSAGAIKTTNIVTTLDINKVCAFKCKNTEGYGSFADLYSRSLINTNYLSACYNDGKSATIRFWCSKQTLANINSSFNTANQEACFLTAGAVYSMSRFIEASSNVVNTLGFNFFNGEKYYGSRFNYNNCTCKNQAGCHIFVDVCTSLVDMSFFYINVKDENNVCAITVARSEQATITISDSIFAQNSRTSGSVTFCSNIKYASVKTLHFSFFSTDQCKTAKAKICSMRKTRNCSVKICFIIHIMIQYHA